MAGGRSEMRIGVVSDTHGLVRPEALAALEGVDHVLHAGDVGKPEVLAALEEVAPVTAVRGNVDVGPWADALPERITVSLGGVRMHVLHDLKALDLQAADSDVSVVVAGHSHQPRAEERDGVLFFNPGSIGPRRFRLPVSLGLLRIRDGAVTWELVPLG